MLKAKDISRVPGIRVTDVEVKDTRSYNLSYLVTGTGYRYTCQKCKSLEVSHDQI